MKPQKQLQHVSVCLHRVTPTHSNLFLPSYSSPHTHTLSIIFIKYARYNNFWIEKHWKNIKKKNISINGLFHFRIDHALLFHTLIIYYCHKTIYCSEKRTLQIKFLFIFFSLSFYPIKLIWSFIFPPFFFSLFSSTQKRL